ncbi:CD1247 N-terminal domain-containing protein [Aneurinibacillus tyrosinisolvens]|uniref:CD1247 N-terminal domain-containing protein n=1 Tax=Aneurinibacillus tyrosinisolvens TaxID=1443435 RepID=UPI00069C276F|nr:CD1247 N-terminal domain-containing protein [Aneurinibacillus tyrosinisolvens]
MDTESRISYLRGLADGMEIEKSKEGQLIHHMIRFMEEMNDSLMDAHARLDEQEEYIEAIDEDLAETEAFLFDEEEYEDYDYDDEYEFALNDDDDDMIDEIYLHEDDLYAPDGYTVGSRLN